MSDPSWLIDKSALVRLGASPQAEQWANRIQRGQHRAPSIPDLLIAATAELSNRIVLHVDKDFELIADLTNQPVERLVT